MSNIKAGDLVMIVRTNHDCVKPYLGQISTVRAIHPAQWMCCPSCKKQNVVYGRAAELDARKGVNGCPLSWLRKIPPLWELDDIEHKDEIPA